MTYIDRLLTKVRLFSWVILTSITLAAVACGEPESKPISESASNLTDRSMPSTTPTDNQQFQSEAVSRLSLQNTARQTPAVSERQTSGQTGNSPSSSDSASGQDRQQREVAQARQAAPIVPTPTVSQSTSGSRIGLPPGKLAIALLAEVAIAPEHASGYSRSEWRHWIDSDGDGCDTRQEVLAAESIIDVSYESGRCRVSSGRWLSEYDNKETTNPSDLDIDHLVALAEAHESGGWSWNSETRRAYANDLSDERHLIAVSASSNRSKGAKDPNNWLPTNESYRCRYISDWIAVKNRWSLSMDPSEHRFITAVLNAECKGTQISTGNSQDAQQLRTVAPLPKTAALEQRGADPNPESLAGCHPAYEPCLPNRPGDAINCGDLSPSQKPVKVKVVGVDPYRLDRDNNGVACAS